MIDQSQPGADSFDRLEVLAKPQKVFFSNRRRIDVKPTIGFQIDEQLGRTELKLKFFRVEYVEDDDILSPNGQASQA